MILQASAVSYSGCEGRLAVRRCDTSDTESLGLDMPVPHAHIPDRFASHS